MASIDQRIVELKFNAKNFQSGIKAAIASLDNLKKNLNLNKAASEFDKVEKASKKVTFNDLYSSVDNISNRFSTLGIIGMSALNQITTAAMQTGKKLLSALTSPLIEGGKRRALNIEQAKFQIKGLGYEWAQVEDDINYGVKDTAYGLDSAAKAASQLLASQVKVGSEMKTSLRAISGVAAMTSSEYDDIANIFTTVAGNGRLMGDQLMQLSTRGLNAAATLGKYLGKTEGEVREMVSKGKIDFATFSAAMDSAFGEHAKKANETFTGSLSNMKAALARIGAEVASPAYDNMRDIFNSLTPVIDGVKAALVAKGGLIDSIKAGMKYVTDFGVKILNSFGGKEGVAKSLSDTLSKVNRITKAFGSILLAVAKLVSGIVTPIFSAFGEVLAGDILNAIAGALEIIGKFISSLVFTDRMSKNLKKTFVGIFTVIDEVFKILSNVVAIVSDVLFSAFSGTFGFVLDVVLAITGYIGDLIVRIKNLVYQILSLQTIQDLIFVIKSIFDTLRGAIETVYSALRNLAGIIIDSVFDNALWLFDNLAEVFLLMAKALDFTIQKVKEFIQWVYKLPFVQRILNKIKDTFDYLVNNTSEVAYNIKKKLVDAFYAVRDVMSKVINVIKEVLKQYIEIPSKAELIAKAQEMFITAFERVTEIFFKITNAVKDFIDRIREVTSISFDAIVNNLLKVKNRIVEVVDLSGKLSFLSNVFGTVKEGAVNAADGTVTMLDLIKQKLVAFVEWAKSKFSELTMKDVLTAGIGASFLVFMVQMSKFIKTATMLTESVGKIAKTFSGIGKSIQEVIGGIKEIEKAKAQSIKMEALAKIIQSVVLLAGAVAILANMNPENVKVAAGALLILAGGLIALVTAMSLITSKVSAAKISATATQLAAASGAIFGLALSLKLLATIPAKNIVGGLLAITILLAELVVFMKFVEKQGALFWGDALSVIAIAASVMLLATAMKQLGEMSVDKILSAGLVMGALLTALGVMMKLAANTNSNVKATISILALCVSLHLVINAIKKIADMNQGVLITGITRLIGIFTALALLFLATRLAGKNAAKAGAYLILVGVAMNVMVFTIKNIASLDGATMKQAMSAINQMLILFALLVAVTRLAGDNAVKAGLAIMMMSTSMIALSGAMIILSQLSDKDLKRSAAVVETILVTFALLIAATSKMKPAAKTVQMMMITLSILLGAVALLALLDPTNLATATACVDSLILMFAALVASTKFANEKAMMTALMMSAIIAILGGVLALLASLPMENAINVATSLSELMLGLSAAMFILSKISKIGPEAMTSIMGLSAIVSVLAIIVTGIMMLASQVDMSIQTATSLVILLNGFATAAVILSKIGPIASVAAAGAAEMLGIVIAFAAVLVALGGLLALIPGAEEFIRSGIPILEAIGEALGAFVGGLIGGVAEGISYTLVPMARNLGVFMTTLQDGFLSKLSSIDDGVLDSAIKLAELLAIIGGSEIISAIANFVGGGNSIIDLANTLPYLGLAANAFAAQIDGTNLQALDVGAEAARKLAEVANIMTSGGLADAVLGSTTQGLVEFTQNLPELGKAMVDYANSVANLNAEAVSKSIEPIRSLIELSNSINGEGGWMQKILGSNSEAISEFATNLPRLGACLTSYGYNVSELNVNAVNASLEPLKSLIDLSNSINGEGGWMQKIFGSNSDAISNFTENLPTLGSALSSYGQEVSDFNVKATTASLEPLQKLIEISQSVGDEGGWLDGLFGSNSEGVKKFAENLPLLGEGMSGYSDELSGFRVALVSYSIDGLQGILTTCDMIANNQNLKSMVNDSTILTNMKNNLPLMADAIVAYGDGLVGLKAELIMSSIAPLKQLLAALNLVNRIGGGPFESFGDKVTALKEHLPGMAIALVKYSSICGSINNEGINKSVEAINAISGALKTLNVADFAKIAALKPHLKSLGDSLRLFSVTASQTDHDAIASVIEDLKKLENISTNWSALDNISSTLNGFTNLLKNAGSMSVQGFVDALNSGAVKGAAAAIRMVKMTINAAVARLNSANKEFMNRGQTLMVNLANGIRNRTSVVSDAMNSALSGIKGTITNYYGQVYNAGSYLVTGLRNGILDNAYKASEAAWNLGRKVVQKLNEALEINSPSREGESSGKFFDLGIMVGIVKYASKVLGAVTDMGEDIVEEVNNFGFNSFFEDLDPVITPTLDTSNIEKGIAGINSDFSSIGAIPIGMQGRLMSSSFNNLIAKDLQNAEIQNGTPTQVINNYDMTQNNYSPKALSRIDIYRDSKNLFSRLKVVNQ